MAADPAFSAADAATFKTAIRFAMVMGSPTQVADKATFRWLKDQTFNPQDPARRPYHWDEVVITETTHADVVMENVAVEYPSSADSTGTEVGTFIPVKAQLTMLDDDYALIEGADLVLLGETVWQIIMTTVQALFSVGVYTIFCERQ